MDNQTEKDNAARRKLAEIRARRKAGLPSKMEELVTKSAERKRLQEEKSKALADNLQNVQNQIDKSAKNIEQIENQRRQYFAARAAEITRDTNQTFADFENLKLNNNPISQNQR